MSSLYLMILSLSTLSCSYTDGMAHSIKNYTAMYGDCISFSDIFPSRNTSNSDEIDWFCAVCGKGGTLTAPRSLNLPQLPIGRHRLTFSLAGRQTAHPFRETVPVTVTSLTKMPILTVAMMTAGQAATVKCEAPYIRSGETPKITWVGAGQPGRWHPGASEVQITPTAEDHNTNVTCRLQYEHTATEKTKALKVQYSPIILNTSKCIQKENTVLCRCVSSGNPRPSMKWLFTCGSYRVTNASSNRETVEEIVLECHHRASTIQCVSNNHLGSAGKNLTVDHKNIHGGLPLAILPWTITGVSLSLSLAMVVIVICKCRRVHKKKCREEVKTYASLRKTSEVHEYSVIPPTKSI